MNSKIESKIYTRKEVEEFERRPDEIQGWMHTFRAPFTVPEDHVDLREFQRERKDELLSLMERESRSYQGRYKFKFEVEVILKMDHMGEFPDEEMSFYIRQEEPKHVNYYESFNMPAAFRVINEVYQEQNEKLEALTERGSGWRLVGIKRHTLKQ